MCDTEDPQLKAQAHEKEENMGDAKQGGFKVLPFEFVALEACLEAACSCLEKEVILQISCFSLCLICLIMLLHFFCFLGVHSNFFFFLCFKTRQELWS